MKYVIKSAKTIEEAINLGVKDLGLSRNQVEFEVMQQPTKPIFGLFGGSDAVVKVKAKEELKVDLKDIFSDSDFSINSENLNTQRDLDLDNDLEYKIEEKLEKLENQEENLEKEIENKLNKIDKYFETVDESDEEDVDLDSKELFVEEEVYLNDPESLDEEDDFGDEYLDMYEEGMAPEIIKENEEKLEPTEKVESENSLEDITLKAKNILEDILTKMHIETKVVASSFNENIINLVLEDISENDTGIVIGSKGETLNAIQYILNLLVNKDLEKFYRVTINAGDYRNKRKKAIETISKKAAYRVLKYKKSVELKPMNSYERRIVHFTLQDYKQVETVSTGKFPNRKVVIRYKGL